MMITSATDRSSSSAGASAARRVDVNVGLGSRGLASGRTGTMDLMEAGRMNAARVAWGAAPPLPAVTQPWGDVEQAIIDAALALQQTDTRLKAKSKEAHEAHGDQANDTTVSDAVSAVRSDVSYSTESATQDRIVDLRRFGDVIEPTATALTTVAEGARGVLQSRGRFAVALDVWLTSL